MSWWRSALAVVIGMLPGIAPALVADSGRPLAVPCVVVSVEAVGPQAIAAIEARSGLTVRVEADGELLACGAPASLDGVVALSAGLLRREDRLDPDRLRLATGVSPEELSAAGARIVLLAGPWAVVEVAPAAARRLRQSATRDWRTSVEPLPSAALVLARQAANLPVRRPAPGELPGMTAEVDPQRWYADVVELSRFNRYTYAAELADARDLIASWLADVPGVQVETTSFAVGHVTAWNVIGTLTGTTRPDEVVIVGGHYDAISERPMTAAPGAEDNASGCAGVVEMARLLSVHRPAATVQFICYAGEEQGLYGSWDHAGDLVQAGEDGRVTAMVNLDMIGFTADDDLDCLLDGGGGATDLVEVLLAAAEGTRLRMVVSGRPLGSDHLPYLQNGIAATLVIENDYAVYPDYHRSTDLPENLSLEMGGEILRMVAAALVELAGVPTGIGLDEGGGRRELGAQ